MPFCIRQPNAVPRHTLVVAEVDGAFYREAPERQHASDGYRLRAQVALYVRDRLPSTHLLSARDEPPNQEAEIYRLFGAKGALMGVIETARLSRWCTTSWMSDRFETGLAD